MAVTGLPVALATSLNALLSEHGVSSWKIVGGNSETTVLVVRLQPQGKSDRETNMASSSVHNKSAAEPVQKFYRTKPPSAIRRDRERRQQHRMRLQDPKDSQGEFVFSSNYSVEPSLFTSECHNTDTDRPVELSAMLPCVNQGHQASVQSTVTEGGVGTGYTCDTAHAESMSDSPPCIDMDTPVPQDVLCCGAEQETDDRYVRACKVGLTTSIGQDYVATLTDRAVQRHLRDECRNETFSRVVFDGESVLVFESSDIVVEMTYDEPGACALDFWFVKQSDRRMLPEERARLASLAQWTEADLSQHRDAHAEAVEILLALRGVIQFYLG